MDSLGKIFDFLILLIVLFIFPVNWAMGTAEIVGDYSLNGLIEEFLDSAMYERRIDRNDLNSLEEGITDLFKHYELELAVQRGVSEFETDGISQEVVSFVSKITMPSIEEDIEKDGYFSLCINDVLMIQVLDKNGVFLSGVRLII